MFALIDLSIKMLPTKSVCISIRGKFRLFEPETFALANISEFSNCSPSEKASHPGVDIYKLQQSYTFILYDSIALSFQQ